ncbi:hypothetical protein M0R45_025452 [Rubus argutus]|uniref:Retrotransposon Copia-like N-terminal domain-containing protein n=1 Tax=Rubus argutus TaxID=59490 RepID=A0AAW1WW10_RUBAR
MSITQTTVFLPTILLDETNYPSWFFRLESFLKGQKLYGFVDGTLPCPPQFVLDSDGHTVANPEFENWCTQDQSIINMIGQTLSSAATSCANLKKGSDSIETYLDKIKVARDALATVGVFMDDEDVIVTVLRGLPSEYAAIKGVIRAQAVTSTISDLKTLLKATELDIEADSQSTGTLPLTAMVAQATQLLQTAASQSTASSSNGASSQSSSSQPASVT